MSTEEVYRRFAEVALHVARSSKPDVAQILRGIAADYLAKASSLSGLVRQQQQQPQPKSGDRPRDS
jgi:hypothetical protein